MSETTKSLQAKDIRNSLRAVLEEARVSKPLLFSLPPCYCGGKAKFEEWSIAGETFHHVMCTNEKCELATDWYCSVEEASVAWQDLQRDIEENMKGD